MRTPTFTILLLVGGIACGGVEPAPPVTAVAHAEPQPLSAADDDEEPADEPWVTWPLMPFFGDGLRVLDAPDDTAHAIVAGSRATVGVDGRITWADETSRVSLMAAAATEGSWTFLSKFGVVLGSDGFLGPLRPRGELVLGHVAQVFPARGRIVAADERGRLFEVRGAVSRPIAELVLDADASHAAHTIAVVSPGVAVIDPGSDAEVRVDVASVVFAAQRTADGYRLETLGGEVFVGLDGSPRRTGARPTGTPGELGRTMREALRTSARERTPSFQTSWLHGPRGGLVLANNFAFEEDTPRRWDPGQGIRRLPPLGAAADADCFYGAWGDRALARCDERLFLETERGWRSLDPLRAGDAVVAAGDGSAFAFPGRCEAEQDEGLCWSDGETSRWRALEPDRQVVGVWGRYVLVQGLEYEVLDMEDPRRDRTIEPPDDIDLASGHLALDSAGTLHGWAWDMNTDASVGVAGAVGEPPLRTFPLPGRSERFVMADGRRGVAIGNTFADVWITEDGGETFAPMPNQGRGELGAAPLTRDTLHEQLTCGPLSCRVGYLWMWGSPRVRPTPGPPATATQRYFYDPSAPPLPQAGVASVLLHCPSARRAERSWEGRADFGDVDETGLYGAMVVSDGPDPQVRWAFHDRGRIFSARSGSLQGQDLRFPTLLVGATPELLVVIRHTRVLVIRAGASPVAHTLLDESLGDVDLGGWSTRPDGRGGLLVQLTFGRGSQDVDLVAHIQADGEVRVTRHYLWPSEAGVVRGLAMRPARSRRQDPEVGLVAFAPGRAPRFYPAEGGGAVELTTAEQVGRVCGRRDRNGYEVVAGHVRQVEQELSPVVRYFATEREPCLVGVTTPVQAQVGSTWIHAQARGDQIEVQAQGLDFEDDAVRCDLVAPIP